MIRKLLAAAALAAACVALPALAADPPITSLPLSTPSGTTYNEATWFDGSHYWLEHMTGGWTGSAWKPLYADPTTGYLGVTGPLTSAQLGAAGLATASVQATIAANTKPVTSFAAAAIGSTLTPGLGMAVVCTATGNVVLQATDGSQITVPVNMGFNQFGFAVARVVSETATCTFTTLN